VEAGRGELLLDAPHEVRARELRAERFTPRGAPASPASCQARAARRAWPRVQFSSLKMTGLRSTDSISSVIESCSRSGVRQRSSASTLATRPSRASTIGW
jgi:hypothetical protein